MIVNNITSSPLISIIVPTYNSNDYLKKSLDSVLKQTYSNWELIVVDDGSEHSPESILSEYCDDRIKLFIINHANANVARNYGIEKSVGCYIAMLDSDDEWLNNHLEDCLFTIKRRGVDGVYGSLILKSSDSIDRTIYARELRKGESFADYQLSAIFGAQTSTLFMTSESAKNVLWDPDLISHQDYDFVIRFSRKYNIIPKTNPTTIYNSRFNSLSSFLHCPSYKLFAERYYKEIEPSIYSQFTSKTFFYAKKTKQDNKYIDFFKKEMLRYVEFISYQMYISICNPQTFFQSSKFKIKYLTRIIRVRVI